ncbi:hypothetical protein F3Y22_tig00110694pilonHSYRG00275 [Hibiscus syriacus]|uniref:Reverse transcriptase Ty1/copia-type domain-containing protein n=1 Tax=Hibiscus syriacus TaxID=106335 RepID=A0A6A2ZW95_HIBSY|nr:hypothetical protein F3Y22_tig00110694pilonHSYRG00275 [Hibiscus syriacus]
MVESLNDSFDNGENPYYLHQSDNPGMILVNELFSNDKFHSWKRSVILALPARNKLGFIDSSIQAPNLSMVNQFNAWTRANNLVNSWLLNSVSKDIAASLLYHTTTAELWKDLLCSYLQCNCGGVQRMLAEHQQEQVIQYLMGLNESYVYIRGKILLMDLVPPISKAHSGSNTHKNRPLCSHCNILGHTKDRCYKLIGYPPGYNSMNWSSSNTSRGKGSQVIHTNSMVSQQGSPIVTEAFTHEQCQQLIAMLTSQLQTASSLDIPTTSINTAITIFESLVPITSCSVALPNGSIILVSFADTDLHQVIGKGELVQGLYLLQMSSFKTNFSCNSVSSALSSDWHNRLGHPSLHVMHLLKGVLSLKNSQQDKFSARALPAVFLGYPPGVKGPTDSNGGASIGPTNSNDGASPRFLCSSRTIQKSSYLQQYYCNNASSRCLYPIESFISSSKLSTEYGAFVTNILSVVEPSFYHEDFKSPTWRNVRDNELRAIEDLETWTIVPLPDGKNVVDCKWVYQVKYNADDLVDRCKTILVAKGFTQVEGIHYIDAFSPVAKMTSFRVLLSLAATRKWHLLQLDVNNGFLNGILDGEVYMKLPPRYKSELKGSNMVCRLHKSIYGVKQASMQWFTTFSNVVLQLGFQQSLFERFGNRFIVLLVYVDDIVLARKYLQALHEIQSLLQKHFKLKELGPLFYFLVFEITTNSYDIVISQRKYALKLLEDTGCLGAKPVESPMLISSKLSANEGVLLSDSQEYRRLIGYLMYLTNTRPGIVHTMHLLSQFVSSPRLPHMTTLKHLLAYIRSSHGIGLFFTVQSTKHLSIFVDSDYSSCPDTRCSTTGFCVFFAMAMATFELVWLVSLLSSFHEDIDYARLYCDNQAAINLATKQMFHERTKHIEVDCHFVRDKVKAAFLKLFHVRSSDQLADIFTKTLWPPMQRGFIAKLGLLNIHEHPA